MKNLFRFISVTALLVTLAACQKEQDLKEKEEPVAEGVEINIIADGKITPKSKTAVVDGPTPSVKWLSSDQLTIYEIVDDAVKSTTTSTSTTLSENDYVASFQATIPGADPSGSSYKYAAVYPASAVSAGSTFFRLTMPDTQHLIGNNFSNDSDILISGLFDHGDSRVTNEENINFSFRRVGTAVKLTLKGIAADEKIQKVIITAPHFIAGRVKYTRETSSLVSDSWHYASEHQNTITLIVDDLVATGTDVLWFRVLAAEKWAETEELSIAVETDKANYYRNGIDEDHAVITLGKDIEFVDGGLTAFGVGLGSYRVAKPEPVEYILVESSSTIVDGADYLLVYTTGSKAMGAFSSNIYNPTDVTITSKTINITSEDVTIVTLEDAGDNKFYLKVGTNDYIYSPSTNNIYHNAKGAGNEYKWSVETDKIKNVGTNRYIQYNTGSPRFACYSSGQKDVNLYVNLASILPLGISFANASYEFVANSIEFDAFTGQAVTKTGGVSDERTVTYTVDSDTEGIVSSINASTGAIVLSGNIGMATIKASVGATDGVYKAGSVTYTITVTPEPISFIKATSITSGVKYLIVSEYSDSYYMAKAILDGTKSYAYPAQQVVTPEPDGSIVVYDYDNAYTISTTVGGYSIMQSDNRFWYASGNYKTINVSDTPSSVWTIEKQEDDTFKLTSEGTWVQYSYPNSSYGRYSSTQSNSALPYLYVEDDGSPRLTGTEVVFNSPIADIESSTLSTAHLSNVTYSCTSQPEWIDEVEFDGNTMKVTSKDNKSTSERNGIIAVSATGDEGNVSANIAVSQPASVFEASSTAAMNFAWNDVTNSTVKSVTITSTYVLTEGSNLYISGTNEDKFVASLTRVGETDEYTLEVWVAEDNESGANYEAIVTVSRDDIDIIIDLSQAYNDGSSSIPSLEDPSDVNITTITATTFAGTWTRDTDASDYDWYISEKNTFAAAESDYLSKGTTTSEGCSLNQGVYTVTKTGTYESGKSYFFYVRAKGDGNNYDDSANAGKKGKGFIIIDGSQLTSTATTASTDKTYSGITVNFSDGAKNQSSNGDNRFTASAILIGKNGKNIHNTTPLPGEIEKFELYSNKGASAKVTVGLNFSSSVISSYDANATNKWTNTLSTLDNVYNCTGIGTGSKYFFYQVINANNSQVQFRITYVLSDN